MSKRKERCGDIVMGTCVDCGLPERMRDFYIVRNSVWFESGMGAWTGGRLHRHCLEKRLGRVLTRDDLLVWCVGETRHKVDMRAHPDYLRSPEFLLYGGLEEK